MVTVITKYALWLASTGLAFAGAWLVKFTADDPKQTHRRTLTKAGKVALPIAIASFVLAFGLEIRDDRASARAAVRAAASQDELLKASRTQTQALDKLTAVFLTPESLRRQLQADPSLRIRVEDLRADPILGSRIPLSVMQTLRTFGLPPSVVNGASPDRIEALKGESLAMSAGAGQANEVRELLDDGVHPDYRTEGTHEVTPLIFAVQQAAASNGQDPPGYVEVVKLLLAHGAQPDAEYDGSTALAYAVSDGHTTITRLLLAAGADPNRPQFAGRWSPLTLAVKGGHRDIVRLLLDRHVNLKSKSTEGETACAAAHATGSPDLEALLRNAGGCGEG